MTDDNLPAVIEQPAPPVPTGLFGTDDPEGVVERASRIAGALARVIRDQKLSTRIQDRDHVRVEGWTLLGSMLGVFPVCTWTRPLENGWEARVEARTRDGSVVGSAEAMCTRAERTWSTRDEYALRSMAQTRATAKCLRLPLGFVMQLAGYDPTPAEEMPRENGDAKATTRIPDDADRPKSAAAQTFGAISAKQIGLLRARIRERAKATNELTQSIETYVLAKIGVTSLSEMSWKSMDAALELIKTWDPVEDGVDARQPGDDDEVGF